MSDRIEEKGKEQQKPQVADFVKITRKNLDSQIQNAANSPSTSENIWLNNLVALRERCGMNGPGSNLVLPNEGLAIGGSSQEERKKELDRQYDSKTKVTNWHDTKYRTTDSPKLSDAWMSDTSERNERLTQYYTDAVKKAKDEGTSEK